MGELFTNFIVRAVLLWFGIIRVDRGTDRAVEASNEGVVVLRFGGVVITFIDGKISRTGELQDAHNGVSYMAQASGATVVPVALFGTQRVKRPNTGPLHWGWGKRYAVVVGTPILVKRNDHATSQDRDQLTAHIMGAIRVGFERARVLAG